MKDSDGMILMKALASCASLEILNFESNHLSSKGISAVLDMAENHPAIRDLRIVNQSISFGVDADRALANCLSQNTNIIKYSHDFTDNDIKEIADKYIQRNMDLQRKIRTSVRSRVAFIIPPPEPRPFTVPTDSTDATLHSAVLENNSDS